MWLVTQSLEAKSAPVLTLPRGARKGQAREDKLRQLAPKSKAKQTWALEKAAFMSLVATAQEELEELAAENNDGKAKIWDEAIREALGRRQREVSERRNEYWQRVRDDQREPRVAPAAVRKQDGPPFASSSSASSSRAERQEVLFKDVEAPMKLYQRVLEAIDLQRRKSGVPVDMVLAAVMEYSDQGHWIRTEWVRRHCKHALEWTSVEWEEALDGNLSLCTLEQKHEYNEDWIRLTDNAIMDIADPGAAEM
jgi:hypothetical protein